MELLIFQNEQQHGPYSLEQINQFLHSGQVTANSLVWHDGMTDWTPLHSIIEIPTTPPSTLEKAGDSVEKVVDSAISRFIKDEQDPGAVQKVLNKVEGILTSGENVEYVGVQKKPVVTISPDAILLTNKRFIIAKPKMTGFRFEDYLWKDVADVHMSEQMLGATIECLTVTGQSTSIDSIPKKQARRIYAYAQEVEEKMIDQRRNRELEDKRAAAGGVVIQSPEATQRASGDPMEQLSKLKELLEAGLIDQTEFDSKKSEILSRM